MPEIELRGLTWDDLRGRGPLAEVEQAFRSARGGSLVRVRWDVQPLSGFERRPTKEIVDDYDLIVADHPHVVSAAEQGHLLPIGELPDDYVGATLESYRHASQLWAVPVDAACHVSAFRADRVERAPKTWSDVEQLVTHGFRCGVPLRGVHSTMALISIMASMESVASQRPAPIELEADLVAAAMGRIRWLYEMSHPASLDWNPIEALDALAAGQIDFVPLTFGYAHYGSAGIRFDEIPTDHADAVARGVLGGAGLVVSARSKAADIAMEFAKFCGTAEIQQACWSRNGGQPAHRSAWNELANHDDFYRDTRWAVENAIVRPRHQEFAEKQHEIGNAIQAWLADGGVEGAHVDAVYDSLSGELAARFGSGAVCVRSHDQAVRC